MALEKWGDLMIQWFPGHMAKARNEIEEKLKLVDIVFELVDARVPLSSRNPMIREIIKNKPRLVLMTKATKADSNYTKKWQEFLLGEGTMSMVIDSVSGLGINRIVNYAKEVLKDKFEKEQAKGMKERPIRAMVIGIPNVGKSTLINKLVNRKVTTVGDRPGVTKAQQWIRINKDLNLIDTPGVLWPKFDDEITGYNLAMTGAIKDQIMHKDDLIIYFLDFLKKFYPHALNRYNVDVTVDNLDILNKIAGDRGYFQGKYYDYEKVYEAILNDYRSDRLGKITLDRLENV